jgi:hypothetical protein
MKSKNEWIAALKDLNSVKLVEFLCRGERDGRIALVAACKQILKERKAGA